jgi:hypothetical protein
MKTTFAIALLLMAAFAISAQEQQIDKTALENALSGTSDHAVSWSGRSYRMTVTTSAKMTERPELDHAAKMVFEYGPQKSYRNIHTSTTGGKTRPTLETLIVGDSIYKRENDGVWTVTAKPSASTGAAPQPPAPREDPFQTVTSETQYFSLGSQPYKGETANVYKKVEKTRKVNKASGNTLESTFTTTYWIVGGVQRKHELRSAGKGSAYTSNNLIVTEWDLDPAISFQAPVIGK